MRDKEIADKGRELAALVISANQTCNRSKLDEIELERLNVMVDAARGMLTETAEYAQGDDSKAFGNG